MTIKVKNPAPSPVDEPAEDGDSFLDEDGDVWIYVAEASDEDWMMIAQGNGAISFSSQDPRERFTCCKVDLTITVNQC